MKTVDPTHSGKKSTQYYFTVLGREEIINKSAWATIPHLKEGGK